MKSRVASVSVLVLLANAILLADASYQSAAQITGGSLLATLSSGPLAHLTKDLGAPTTTITMVHGNMKAVVTKDSTEVFDLDRGTITRIDTAKKTYTVMTFAQLQQMMANLPNQTAAAQAQLRQMRGQGSQPTLKTSYEASVNNTGATKVINGLTAQEQVVTLLMHVTDPSAPPGSAGSTVTYTVTTDMWIAPDPPEVKEIRDFDQRMSQKLMAGADLSAFQAGAAAAASASAVGMAAMFGGRPGTSDAMTQMGKEVAKIQGTHVLEIMKMSGSGPTANTGATLMERTQQLSNFSHEAIPTSVFQVPSGFKQVPNPFERGR